MEGYFFDDTETSEKTSRAGKQQKKRKWREIEALKDKYQLQRELKSIDILHDYTLDDVRI